MNSFGREKLSDLQMLTLNHKQILNSFRNLSSKVTSYRGQRPWHWKITNIKLAPSSRARWNHGGKGSDCCPYFGWFPYQYREQIMPTTLILASSPRIFKPFYGLDRCGGGNLLVFFPQKNYRAKFRLLYGRSWTLSNSLVFRPLNIDSIFFPPFVFFFLILCCMLV